MIHTTRFLARLVLIGFASAAISPHILAAQQPGTGGIANGKTLAELVQDLRSPDRDKRVAASNSILLLGADAKTSVADLVRVLEDTDGLVRYNIVQTLVKIGKDAGPELAKAYASENPTTRFYAATALKKIGLPLPQVGSDPNIPKQEPGKTIQGQLTKEDPFDPKRKNCHHKIHTFEMTANKEYVIELRSQAFDSFLRLEDATGKQLAADDDGGGFPHAKITFSPKTSGPHRIIVTTFGNGATGAYTLQIQESVK